MRQFCLIQGVENRVGVFCQCSRDPTDRIVVRFAQEAVLFVSSFPQELGRELKQRQARTFAPHRTDHLAYQLW